jgi:hypothetical protein
MQVDQITGSCTRVSVRRIVIEFVFTVDRQEDISIQKSHSIAELTLTATLRPHGLYAVCAGISGHLCSSCRGCDPDPCKFSIVPQLDHEAIFTTLSRLYIVQIGESDSRMSCSRRSLCIAKLSSSMLGHCISSSRHRYGSRNLISALYRFETVE